MMMDDPRLYDQDHNNHARMSTAQAIAFPSCQYTNTKSFKPTFTMMRTFVSSSLGGNLTVWFGCMWPGRCVQTTHEGICRAIIFSLKYLSL